MFSLAIIRRLRVASLLSMGVAALLLAPAARALDAIVLEAREVTVAGIAVQNASLRLDLLSDKRTRIDLRAAAVELPDPIGRLTSVALTCDAPLFADPRFGCEAGRLSGRGGPAGVVDTKITFETDLKSGVSQFAGSGLSLAGTTAAFEGRLDAQGWTAKARTGTTSIPALRKFAKPWFELPADFTVAGNVAVEGSISDRGKGVIADIAATLANAQFTNVAGDIVGEKLGFVMKARVEPREKETGLTLDVSGDAGQAFLSVLFFDFDKNALHFQSRGALRGSALEFETLHLVQADLADITGSGRLDLAPEVPAFTGDLAIAKLEFPAAYSTYMANVLASSLLGDLATRGRVSGEVSVRDNGVIALHLVPKDLELKDNKGRLYLKEVNGDVSWAPAGETRASRLSWSEGGAYGLSGGAATLDFLTYGMNFALTRPTKLPVFDGAIDIQRFAMGNLGADDMEVAFKGNVEPI